MDFDLREEGQKSESNCQKMIYTAFVDNSMEPVSSVVHRQLQDVIKAQRNMFETLTREKNEVLESSVSRDCFERLQSELMAEREAHKMTSIELEKTRAKLKFAKGEIEILKNQLKKEKSNFETSIDKVQRKAHKESTRNAQLQEICSEISAERQRKEDLVVLKDTKIDHLQQQLANKKRSYSRQLNELNIQLQQEAYINQVLAKDKKQNRSGVR